MVDGAALAAGAAADEEQIRILHARAPFALCPSVSYRLGVEKVNLLLGLMKGDAAFRRALILGRRSGRKPVSERKERA
jgi:hypothetical protein